MNRELLKIQRDGGHGPGGNDSLLRRLTGSQDQGQKGGRVFNETSDNPREDGDQTPEQNPGNIVLQAVKTFKKIPTEAAELLNLPKVDHSTIQSAVRTLPNGSQEMIYVLSTSEGSHFALDPNHPFVQELQATAAIAAVDGLEAQTPIQAAGAIKRALKENFDMNLQGGPFEAWDFAIKAMDKMIEFNRKGLTLNQINLLQAATKQTQEDVNLPLHQWLFLPPHRKLAAMMTTEMALAAAMEEHISGSTLEAAKNMEGISLALAQRRKDLMQMWVNFGKENVFGAVDRAGESAWNLIGRVLNGDGENTLGLTQIVMGMLFGKENIDEGAVQNALDKSGEAGQELLKMIRDSGMTIHEFFRSLFKGEKKPGINNTSSTLRQPISEPTNTSARTEVKGSNFFDKFRTKKS